MIYDTNYRYENNNEKRAWENKTVLWVILPFMVDSIVGEFMLSIV
jgi:hypothetical protein